MSWYLICEKLESRRMLSASPDRFEPNDTFETATDLPLIAGAIDVEELSIDSARDSDFFTFTLVATATADDFVAIRFTHAAGDLDTRLRDSRGIVVGNSESASDEELISLEGLPPGVYEMEVYGYGGDTNEYRMSIRAGQPEAPPEHFDIGEQPIVVAGQATAAQPARYSFAAVPGGLVSLRVAGQSSRSDFSIAVFDATNPDPVQQRQVRFNDNAAANTLDAGLDFVVPAGGGAYRVIVTNVPGASPHFTLTATAQSLRITVPAMEPAFRHPIAVAASGMMHLTGDAAIGSAAQIALYNEAGDLVTTSGASGLSGSLRIDQFVLPGRYAVGIAGFATQPIPLRMAIEPAEPPNADIGVGQRPEAMSTADVNGDGRLDIVTANDGSEDVSILLGNGDGTFAAQRTVAVGRGPGAISTADVNGDGRLDIVTANSSSHDVSILLGNGDGTFAAQQTVAVGRGPGAISTADVDGDGRLDIVTVNSWSDDVSILLGNGDGTFTAQPRVAVGLFPRAISTADVNGDGRLDIVTTNFDSHNVSILLGNGDGTFAAQRTVAVGREPRAISTRDLNGDGRLDIVTVNSFSDDVSILHGNGDGTFAAQQTVAVGQNPGAISITDLNGDGRLDIVTANSFSDDVSILLGNGDGTFAAQQTVTVGSTPGAISTADLNGDGRLDIVTANSFSDDISILLGNDDGTFAAQQTVALGQRPEAMSTVDLNGDGRLDIVTVNSFSDDISILRGNGDGTFADQQTVVVGQRPKAMSIADVNGDGRLDIVTANSRSDDVSILLGNGDGTFATQPTVAGGLGPQAISTADVNGDGRLDIVTANVDSNDVSILFGNGDGTFADQLTVAVGREPVAMAISDVNSDGRLDIVTVNSFSEDVSLLLGNGDGTFAAQPTLAAGRDPRAISIADVNGDGWLDIFVANSFSDDVTILLGNGDGTFAAQPTVAVGSGPRSISITDVNGDGRADIVTVNSFSDDVSILLGNGDGTFAAQQTVAVGQRPKAISIADINVDDRLDIVTANQGSDDVSILLGNGDDTFATKPTVAVGRGPQAISPADVDGDGRLDIVTANYDSNDVSILLGNGDGTFATQPTVAVGRGSQAISAADVNGDGRLDIVTANSNSDDVSILLGNGDGTFADQQTVGVGSDPRAISIADVNGDGRLDIVTANSFSDDVSILLGNGDGTFAPQRTVAVGSGPQAISTADVNGDGQLDIVTAHSRGSDISILVGNSDGTFAAQQTVAVGSGPRAIVIADVNGDGRPDIATANSFSDDVSILLGNGDGTFAARQTVAVGSFPTAIAIADVNGDGRLDIVTANVSSDDVSILLGNGDGTFAAQPTVVVASGPCDISTADLNGDGKLDVVTANQSSDGVSILLGNGDGTFQDTVLRQGVKMTRVGPTATSSPASQKVTITQLNEKGSLDTLTLDRRGTVNARYDADPTTYGLDLSFRALPVGSVGKGFDIRELAASAAVTAAGAKAVLIDKSRRMLLTATPDAAGDLGDATFVTPISFFQSAVGDNPVAVATTVTRASLGREVVDFNRDGVPDVVAANYPSGTVSVLLGRGDGMFQPQRVIPVGHRPSAVLVVDADGDGNPDIVTASDLDKSIALLLGNDDGTFRGRLTASLDSAPTSFAVADVDADGRLDVVTVNVSTSTATVLRGTAGGPFVATQSLDVGRSPQAVKTADVDGDGRLDIVTLDKLDGTVSILLGNGDGTFATQRAVLAVGRLPESFASADLNRDGRADVVTANKADGTVSVLMSDPNEAGGFKPQRTLQVTGEPVSVTVADVDGNFLPDIIANSTSGFSILLAQPDGRFSSQRSFPVSFGPTAAAAVDVNGDFRIDLVSVTPASDSVTVMLGYGDGTFASQEPNLSRLARAVYLPPAGSTAAAGQAESADEIRRATDRLVDLNGDGFADLVVSNVNAGSIDIFPSGPDGRFLMRRGGQGALYSSEWQRVSAGTGPTTVLLADVNGDGAADLVSANQVSGDVSVRLGVPGVVGTLLFAAASGFGPEFRYRTSSRVYGYDLDPFSGRGSAIAPQKLSDIALGDVTGDGIVDLVATSSQDRSFSILTGFRGSDGRWAGFGPPERQSTFAEVRDVAVGDFDKNGIADFVLLDPVGEKLFIHRQQRQLGPVFIGNRILYSQQTDVSLEGVGPKSVQLADIAGPAGKPDGILDIVVGNDFGDVLTLQGVGDGAFKPYVRADRAVALLAADMDGDGKDDFIYGSKGLDRIRMDRTATRQSFEADQSKGVLGPSAVASVTETIGGKQYKNLIVANGGANQILLFRRDASAAAGSGEMFLPKPQTFYVGTNPSAVFVDDVNQDGLPDVVIANEGSNDVSVMVGVNDDSGRWTMKAGPRLSSGGSAPAGITVGDFLGEDGIPDIAVTNRGSDSAAILRGIAGGFFNDVSPTFLPVTIPSPGPIVTVSRPNLPPLIVVGSAANQFQTFGQSGSGFTASTPISGFGSTLATTTFGGSTYLAAGSTAGGVSIYLGGTSSLKFHAEGKILPGLTGLSFDSAGRLFGVTPARDGALDLFSFSPPSGQSGQANSGGLFAQAQAFVTRLVFTPLKATGIGLVATLVTSEGARLADRASEKSLEKTGGNGEADGGNAEEEPAREDGEEPAQEAEERQAESNPLLEFMLDLDGMLRLQNRRLIESLLKSAADELAARRMAKPRDGDPGDRDAIEAGPRDNPRTADPPAASRRGDATPDSPDETDSDSPEASRSPAGAVTATARPIMPSPLAGVSNGDVAVKSRPTLRPPEPADDHRSWALIELFRAGLAFLQAG